MSVVTVGGLDAWFGEEVTVWEDAVTMVVADVGKVVEAVGGSGVAVTETKGESDA